MDKISYFFLGTILYLPAWIFKSGFSIFELSVLFCILYVIPLIFHFIIFKYKKNNDSKLFILYLSIIFTYSLDQNYGMMSYMDRVPNFLNIKIYPIYIYASGIITVLTIISIIFIYIYKTKSNGTKILLAFTFAALIINLFDNRNANVFEKNYNITNEIKVNLNNKPKTLILILDEMSGINSFESNQNLGTKNKIEEFFKKYNFVYYKNAFSLSSSSRFSIPMLFNFAYDDKKIKYYEKLNFTEWIEGSKYWLVEAHMKRNNFFDLYNKIEIFQSMHLNFCTHKNVNSCFQYNPFKRDYKYISGSNNPNFSRIISLWKIQGSIFSNFIWRTLREFSFIDNILEPYGQKMIFEDLLDKVNYTLINSDSDLIFAHILVPHKPYGYNENCEYDGKRSMRYYKMSILDKVTQHNIERECVIKFLDKMFEKIILTDSWQDLNIAIFSDHGARVSKENFNESYFSSIFAVKSKNLKSFGRNDISSIQYLFSKYFNPKHNK